MTNKNGQTGIADGRVSQVELSAAGQARLALPRSRALAQIRWAEPAVFHVGGNERRRTRWSRRRRARARIRLVRARLPAAVIGGKPSADRPTGQRTSPQTGRS